MSQEPRNEQPEQLVVQVGAVKSNPGATTKSVRNARKKERKKKRGREERDWAWRSRGDCSSLALGKGITGGISGDGGEFGKNFLIKERRRPGREWGREGDGGRWWWWWMRPDLRRANGRRRVERAGVAEGGDLEMFVRIRPPNGPTVQVDKQLTVRRTVMLTWGWGPTTREAVCAGEGIG